MVLADIFGMDGVIVLIVIVLILFGAPQIPKLARSLGTAKGEFQKGLADGEKATREGDDKKDNGSTGA